MPRNISIYVPDALLQKMGRYDEVNWSEIARTAIEDYVADRERAYLQHYIPFAMGDAGNVPYRLRAVIRKHPNDVLFTLNINNQSENDLIIDRISYNIELMNEEKDNLYLRKGHILERRYFEKGSKDSFHVILKFDEELWSVLDETVHWDFSGTIHYFSKKGFLTSRFWAEQDSDGTFPVLEVSDLDDASAEETVG